MEKQMNKENIIQDALKKTFNDTKSIISKYIKQLDESEIERALTKSVEYERIKQKLERW